MTIREEMEEESTSNTPVDSVFEEVIATHTLHIAPRYLGDLRAGAKSHLDVSLLKYSQKLGGIPLSYGKVELSPKSSMNEIESSNIVLPSAAITFDNPCVHLSVRVYWMLFSPKPKSRLMGVVNQAGREHVGLLVLNYFSAVIYANQLSAVLSWNDTDECWESRKGEILSIGQEICFEVVELLNDGPVFTIVGSLDRMLVEQQSVVNAKSPHRKHASKRQK
jgi:hypothetical protein